MKDARALNLTDILYEDDWVIAVHKPSGLPTQGTVDPNRDHLVAALTRLLTARDGRVPYLGLHHRLDRDTSGIVILARAKKANRGLTDAFRDRLAKKTYWALSQKVEEPGHAFFKGGKWEVDNHLARERGGGSHRQRSVHSGGDKAQTDFVLLEVAGDRALVEASPRTGRTHQIRVHLSEGGLPILGDLLYKGPGRVDGKKVGRVMLHAYRLVIPHPITGELLTVECSPPRDFCELSMHLGLASTTDH